MKKQPLKKVVHKIDDYLIEINISSTKFYTIQTLLGGDMEIQRSKKETVKKLRRENSSIKILESKAKLACK